MNNREIAEQLFVRMASRRPVVPESKTRPYSYDEVAAMADYSVDCGLILCAKFRALDRTAEDLAQGRAAKKSADKWNSDLDEIHEEAPNA